MSTNKKKNKFFETVLINIRKSNVPIKKSKLNCDRMTKL